MITPRDDQKNIRLVQENFKTTVLKVKETLQLNVRLGTVRTLVHEANLTNCSKQASNY